MIRLPKRMPRPAGAARLLPAGVVATLVVSLAAPLAVCLLLSATPAALAIEPDAPERLISFDDTIGIALQQRLAQHRRRFSKAGQAGQAGQAEQNDRDALAEFYRKRGNQVLWVSRNGLNERAVAVMSEIRKAGDWALPVAAFKLPKLALASAQGPKLAANLLARAETQLSLMVLKYARFARGGRSEPSKISEFLDRQLPLIPPREVMQQISTAADPAAVLRGFHPTHPQFLALLKAYHALVGGKAAGNNDGRPMLPAGPSLKLGITSARVAILRKRLGMAAVAPQQENRFDEDVDVAVRDYQKAAGLSVDGVVGAGTRRALNGGNVKGDPQKLLVNIEEWRWMPHDMGKMYVLVNVPEFKVRVYQGGQVIHSARVVVGKPVNQTPIFSKDMKWVEFHPSWYVPESIKVREIGPNLRRRGSAFLERMDIKVTCPGGAYLRRPRQSNFWDAPQPRRRIVNIRNCRVVQLPGPKNVLGVVKFKFPNKHSVYLHDTTSKTLFNKRVRAYSHGCVRVRNPLKLAEIILQRDQGMSSAHIQSIVDGPVQTQQIYLKKRLPVHVVYFTAFADQNGKVHYFRDIYGHEKRIALALKGRYDEIVPVPVARSPMRVARRSPVRRKPKNFFEAIFGGFN